MPNVEDKVRVLAIIEGCPISVSLDGKVVTYVAKAAIDGDGTGASHGDPDFQPRTSLKPDLNSDTDPYIVVPPAIIEGVPGVVLGCQAKVLNRVTRLSTNAVVGDVGPHAKLGEISIACAKAIGVNPSPTTGGENSHVIEYHIYPGLPAVVNGKQYSLQPSK